MHVQRILREFGTGEWVGALALAVAMISGGLVAFYGNRHDGGLIAICAGIGVMILATVLYAGHHTVLGKDERTLVVDREAARPPAQKTMVDVTPEEFRLLLKDHTSIQAAKLAEAYVGKWMIVSGPVGDVDPFGSFVQVTFTYEDWQRSLITVYMYFTSENDRLALLRRNEQITVCGRIKEVSAAALHLDDCELVASGH
jgi:hypothetical protein